METWDAIRARRNVRQYTDQPIAPEHLDRILEASTSGMAVRAIVVDAATKRGRSLYERFGFVAAPGHVSRMIVRAETIARSRGLA